MANASLSKISAMAGRVEDGAALVWAARGEALKLPIDVMERMGAPAKSIAIRKSLTSSALEAAGAGPINAFAGSAAPQSAFLRMVSDRSFQLAPMRLPLLYSTGDVSAAMVTEGAPITAVDVALDGVKLTPRKAATILTATKEAWGDISGPGQAYINALLRKAVGKVADGQMIAALGTIPAETAAADDSAAVRSAFQEMAAQLIREAGQRMRWILSPQAVAMLAPFAPADRIEVNLDGTGTIFGAPIMVSTALPAGDLLLVSASDVAANLMDAEIEASDEADITMINAEDATHVVSMWQTNSVAVRTILTFGLEPLRDTVAARLTLTGVA